MEILESHSLNSQIDDKNRNKKSIFFLPLKCRCDPFFIIYKQNTSLTLKKHYFSYEKC